MSLLKLSLSVLVLGLSSCGNNFNSQKLEVPTNVTQESTSSQNTFGFLDCKYEHNVTSNRWQYLTGTISAVKNLAPNVAKSGNALAQSLQNPNISVCTQVIGSNNKNKIFGEIFIRSAKHFENYHSCSYWNGENVNIVQSRKVELSKGQSFALSQSFPAAYGTDGFSTVLYIPTDSEQAILENSATSMYGLYNNICQRLTPQ